MPFSDGGITSRHLCIGAVTDRTIADEAVTTDKVADGAIERVKFASGIEPVLVVDTLPLTADEGQVAYLTTDSKLYRYDGSAWISLIDAADIDGDIYAAGIASGPSLPGTGSAGDLFFLTGDEKLYRHNGTSWIVATDGGDITTGTVTADAIAAGTITAAEISAGTITATEIAANTITANEIASGTITAGLIAAGAIGADQLAAVYIGVGKYIRSTSYSAGVSGWSIDADGSAEFNDVTVRGSLIGDVTVIDGNGSITIDADNWPSTTDPTITFDADWTSDAVLRYANLSTYAYLLLDSGGSGAYLQLNSGGGNDARLAAGTGGTVILNGDVNAPSYEGEFWIQPKLIVGNAITSGSITEPWLTFYNHTDLGWYPVKSGVMGFAPRATGSASVTQTTAGIMLQAYGANTTSRHTPAILFASSDPDITTTTPKSGAAITGTALQSFSGDTTGWMGIAFHGYTTSPGASPGAMSRIFDTFRNGDITYLRMGDNDNDSIAFDNGTGNGQFRLSIAGVNEFYLSDTQLVIPNVYSDSLAGSANIAVASNGRIQRVTSARKYKTDEEDASWLADIALRPVSYTSLIDGRSLLGQIADDLAVQDHRLGVYHDGDVEDYDLRAVVAVLAAKVNRLETAARSAA